ncbi:MAG: hypothetical protein R2695_00365 [Acidimicrobiales bacterium]
MTHGDDAPGWHRGSSASCRITSTLGWSSTTLVRTDAQSPWVQITSAKAITRPARCTSTVVSSSSAETADTNVARADRTVCSGRVFAAAIDWASNGAAVDHSSRLLPLSATNTPGSISATSSRGDEPGGVDHGGLLLRRREDTPRPRGGARRVAVAHPLRAAEAGPLPSPCRLSNKYTVRPVNTLMRLGARRYRGSGGPHGRRGVGTAPPAERARCRWAPPGAAVDPRRVRDRHRRPG